MISSGRKEQALNPTGEKILRMIEEPLSKQQSPSEEGVQCVIRMASNWDYVDRLPGMDLLRIIAATPRGARYKTAEHDTILNLGIRNALEAPEGQQINPNLVTMAFRVIANLFLTGDGRKVATDQAEAAVQLTERVLGVTGGQPIGQGNRNMLIAVATTILNYSVQAYKSRESISPQVRARFVLALGKIISEQMDGEVVFRALVSLGTFLCIPGEGGGGEAKGWIISAVSRVEETRIQHLAQECLNKIR